MIEAQKAALGWKKLFVEYFAAAAAAGSLNKSEPSKGPPSP
jgi:hypothetical protein